MTNQRKQPKRVKVPKNLDLTTYKLLTLNGVPTKVRFIDTENEFVDIDINSLKDVFRNFDYLSTLSLHNKTIEDLATAEELATGVYVPEVIDRKYLVELNDYLQSTLYIDREKQRYKDTYGFSLETNKESIAVFEQPQLKSILAKDLVEATSETIEKLKLAETPKSGNLTEGLSFNHSRVVGDFPVTEIKLGEETIITKLKIENDFEIGIQLVSLGKIKYYVVRVPLNPLNVNTHRYTDALNQFKGDLEQEIRKITVVKVEKEKVQLREQKEVRLEKLAEEHSQLDSNNKPKTKQTTVPSSVELVPYQKIVTTDNELLYIRFIDTENNLVDIFKSRLRGSLEFLDELPVKVQHTSAMNEKELKYIVPTGVKVPEITDKKFLAEFKDYLKSEVYKSKQNEELERVSEFKTSKFDYVTKPRGLSLTHNMVFDEISSKLSDLRTELKSCKRELFEKSFITRGTARPDNLRVINFFNGDVAIQTQLTLSEDFEMGLTVEINGNIKYYQLNKAYTTTEILDSVYEKSVASYLKDVKEEIVYLSRKLEDGKLDFSKE
jgi:hypothetical protein